MILGLLSIILDYTFFNIFNYQVDNVFLFPMFTLVFLISSIIINVNIKKIITIYIFYSFLNGVIFLPLFIIYITFIVKQNNSLNNYLLCVISLLIIYDYIFFLCLSLSSYELLINKLIVSLPINIFYSLIIYYNYNVLKYHNN